MSGAVKRKHVQRLDDDWEPPKEDQTIAKILKSRGNNLHEVETADGATYLVSMPQKFRKNVWVKRGDYVLTEPIAEGDRVKAEIIRVLTAEHQKEFKKLGVWPWPTDGDNKEGAGDGNGDEDPASLADDEVGLVPNTNRRRPDPESAEESESSIEESSENDTDDDDSDEGRSDESRDGGSSNNGCSNDENNGDSSDDKVAALPKKK